MQPRKTDRNRGDESRLPGNVAFEREPEPLVLPVNEDLSAGDVDSWRVLKAIMRRDRERWLVRLRWIAILGVIGVVSVAGALDWVEETAPLFATAAFMGAYNLVFWRFSKESRSGRGPRHDENTIFLPILADLASLTMLLHWSGGIDNPFALFFTFHMAIGATLLSTRQACALGAAGSFFWGGTILAEYWRWIPHHHIYLGGDENATFTEFAASGLQVGGYLTAFVLMLFGIIYFVRTVEQGRWAAEAKALQREKLALSRSRMARIGEITAGVAHTVRNPLQGVLSCLDLLRAEACGTDEKAVELIDMIDGGLQRVERVTRRLLTLTRERKLNKTPTDLNALILDSIGFLKSKAAARDMALELRLAELPPVTLDPDSIGEVVMNLVDNAIDACSPGDQVLVETSLVGPRGDVVGICVCDSGPGIPEEQLDRVFDPFFTTKTVGEGAGLGLAIVREIISVHSGTVRALGHSGGSCFRLLLPVDAESDGSQGIEFEHEQAFRPCC